MAAIGREQISLPPGTLVIARTLAPRASLEPRGIVGRLLFHDHLYDGSSYLMMGDDADDQVVRCGYPVACPEDILSGLSGLMLVSLLVSLLC